MDRDELSYHEAAARRDLSVRKNDDGTWSVGAPPNVQPLRPGHPIEPSETFISGDRIRLADGRIFPLRMTTDELRDALGITE